MKEFVEDLIEHTLNSEQSKECLSLLNISREFENIGDYINKFVTYKTKLSLDGDLTEEKLRVVSELFDECHSLFHISCLGIVGQKKLSEEEMLSKSQAFKSKCESIRHELSDGNLVFSDMLTALRKIRSHSYRLYLEI
jgi:Na+/phosphate symporter